MRSKYVAIALIGGLITTNAIAVESLIDIKGKGIIGEKEKRVKSWKDRKAVITVMPLTEKKEIDITKKISKGFYTVDIKFPMQINGFVYISLPKNIRPLEMVMEGKEKRRLTKIKRGLYKVYLRGDSLNFEVFAKTRTKFDVKVAAVGLNGEYGDEEVLKQIKHFIGNIKVKEGIGKLPKKVFSDSINFTVAAKGDFKVLVNGKDVKDRIGQIDTLENGMKVYHFIAVRLKEGKNIIEYIGKKVQKKAVFVERQGIKGIEVKTLNNPVADGRTPVYVRINLKGVKKDGYIDVIVDKGEIYDYREGRFIGRSTKVRVVKGEAIIKLSPANKVETRTLRIRYGAVEKKVKVEFRSKKREWIVAGTGQVGIGKGSEFGVFAAGSVKDYGITFRYKTRNKNPVLMKENKPDKFYPVYGDESEQYFEAKSEKRLYVRVEKDKSYMMYGDFKTNIGKDLDLNRYDRVFNGVKAVLNEKKWKIKTFWSHTKQETVREEIKGKGISFYSLKGVPLENSERVYIEVRDRYNPQIVLKRKQLERYVDYRLDYDTGSLQLYEPLNQYDDNFNPQYLVVIYEVKEAKEKKNTYGMRIEKKIKGIRVGLTGVKEERIGENRNLYGIDVKTDNFQAEYSVSKGKAFSVKGEYKGLRYFYKRAGKDYENKGATAPAGEAAGISYEAKIKEAKLSLNANINNSEGSKIKQASLITDIPAGKGINAILGTRYVKEKRESALAVAGISYRKNNLSLKLIREQSLSGKNDYYPSRWIGRVSYLLGKTSLYLQSEYQERTDKNVSLTTFGMRSSITENTSAFSEYRIEDSVSGYRMHSHVGINRYFNIGKYHISVKGENVHTFSGEKENYTAIAVRGVYTQSDRYKLFADTQVRFGNEKPQQLLRVGGAVKIGKDKTVFIREKYLLSSYKTNDFLLSFAYRPAKKLQILSKATWKTGDCPSKYILSSHVFYKPFKNLSFSTAIAGRFMSGSNSLFLREKISLYPSNRTMFSVYGGILRNFSAEDEKKLYGIEAGYTIYKNIQIIASYSFKNIKDEDFGDKGFFFGLRFKFDENLFLH